MDCFARRWGRALSLLLLALFARAAGAQIAAPGSRVRIVPVANVLPTEGTLVAMNADTISVQVGLSSTTLSMPMDSVRTVDVSRGIYSNFGHVVRDGAIGLVAGVGLVVLAGGIGCSHNTSGLCAAAMLSLARPAGALGLVAGVLIARSHKTESWDRVYERPRTTGLIIGPTPRGFAVGLSIPFGAAAAQ